jgi:hypothetical protein
MSDIHQNRFYTTTNSSIYIYVVKLVKQDEDNIEAEVAYITKQGTPLGLEKVLLKRNNIKHWIEVPNVPFSF